MSRRFNMRNLSLRTHISVFFIAFLVITLSLVGLIQIVFLDTFYTNFRVQETANITADIVEHITPDSLIGIKNDRTWTDDVLNICSAHETDLMITDLNGVELYHNNTFTPSEIFFRVLSTDVKSDYIAKALASGGTHSGRISHGSGGINQEMLANILYCSIMDVGETEQAAVFVHCRLVPVNATVETLKSQYIFICVTLAVIAIVFATAAARHISTPIVRITKESQKLASGSFDLNLDDSGFSEIATLNDTLVKTSSDLQRNERLQKDLVANISHDLRTPLTLIQGYAEMMRDIPGAYSAENMQVILDETHYLSALVNDMLDLSKIQSGNTRYDDKRLNLTQLINDLMTRYTSLRKSQGYVIDFEQSEDVHIVADELRISQVVYNLVNNAVNYAGEDKTVIIRQTVTDDKVRISVTDHGDGIPEDKLTDIWERYYKVDSVHVRAQKGTGLGLSIVKSILTHYNTNFGVISSQDAPDKGSTFWFEFDVDKE